MLRRSSSMPCNEAQEGYRKDLKQVHNSQTDQEAEGRANRQVYEVQRIRDGSQHLIDICAVGYPLYILICSLRLFHGTNNWREMACLAGPISSFFPLLYVFRQRLREHASRSAATAVIFQTVLWVATTACFSFGSLSMNTELARHRTFLTLHVPTISIFTKFAYVPPKVYIGFYSSWNFLVWVGFHWAVDFLNLPCVIYGLVSSVGMVLDKHAFSLFEATQALDRERQFQQAMHETLQEMLSSLFDASCTCNQAGEMLSWTPQLRDLLGGHEQWGVSLDICGFAASSMESHRLRHFLEQICQSGCHRAQTIQASLRPAGMVGSNSSGQSQTVEVKMFGIMLPDRISAWEDCESKCIFIGFQGQGTATSLPDSMSLPVDESSLNMASDILTRQILEVQQTARNSHDPDDLAESIVGSLSYTKGHSSEAGTHQSWSSKQKHHQPSFSLVNDASVQTESGALSECHPCPRCQLPRPRQKLTREFKCLKDWKRRQVDRKKAQLNFSKKVLDDFDETPTQTIVAGFLNMARAINASGQGCCPFHVLVARLQQVLKMVRLLDCDLNFLPFKHWQCNQCKGMNENGEDDEDEERRPSVCFFCNNEQCQQMRPEGSDSGNQADLNSDIQGSITGASD